MCSVLEFSSESDKLRTLFSESNHFDSVLFIFDGGRRYKVSSSSLGMYILIHVVDRLAQCRRHAGNARRVFRAAALAALLRAALDDIRTNNRLLLIRIDIRLSNNVWLTERRLLD